MDHSRLKPLSKNQAGCLLMIILLGLLLRFAGVARSGLSHYDEAIYVLSGVEYAVRGTMHSAQPLHAPPLFPWLLAGAFRLTAFWPALAPALVVLVGAATIPLAFAIFRRLAENRVALLMTGLLAASDLHRAFSRMALTDVPLTFWFVLAIYCFLRLGENLGLQRTVHPGNASASTPVLRRGGFWPTLCWTLAAGLSTAAAWNTKYNGWMPLAVAFCAALVLVIRGALCKASPPEVAAPARSTPRLMLCLSTAALISICGFLPWVAYVQATYPGGYRTVLTHHAGYFGGWFSWPSHALRLIGTVAAFRQLGWLMALGLIAFAALVLLRRSAVPRVTAWLVGLTILSGCALLGLGVDATLILLVPCCAPRALVRGGWPEVLIATWAVAFVVSTPLYQPYARLLVPLLPAAIGLVVPRLAGDFSGSDPGLSGPLQSGPPGLWHRSRLWIGGLGLAALLAFWQPLGFASPQKLWNRWETRQSYRRLETEILTHTDPGAVVLCQGQPNLAVYCPRPYLMLADQDFREVLARIPIARECYLVIDFLIVNEPASEARRALESARDMLEPIAVIENDLNLVTLLDFLSPGQLATKLKGPVRRPAQRSDLPPPIGESPSDTIVLYRVRRGRLPALGKP